METLIDFLAEAREAHRRNDWRASYAAFVRADGLGSIPPDDLDAYAASAWRLGHRREAVRLAERAYARAVRADPAAAAMTATVLAMQWHARGHNAVAQQWADRAHRLAGGSTRSVDGYLAYLDAATALTVGDTAGLSRAATALRQAASETGDATLGLLNRVIDGVAALWQARAAESYRLLDDALLPMLDDRIPLDWAGDAYRLVLSWAQRADAQHRRVWTESMQRWAALTGVAVPVG